MERYGIYAVQVPDEKAVPVATKRGRSEKTFGAEMSLASLLVMQAETMDAPIQELSQKPKKEIHVTVHNYKKKRTLEEFCTSLALEERIVDLPGNEKVNVSEHTLTYLRRSGVSIQSLYWNAPNRRL